VAQRQAVRLALTGMAIILAIAALAIAMMVYGAHHELPGLADQRSEVTSEN